jgi:hypothetical protein
MGVISDVAVWDWPLLTHWCQAMPIFGLQLAESLALIAANLRQILNIELTYLLSTRLYLR